MSEEDKVLHSSQAANPFRSRTIVRNEFLTDQTVIQSIIINQQLGNSAQQFSGDYPLGRGAGTK